MTRVLKSTVSGRRWVTFVVVAATLVALTLFAYRALRFDVVRSHAAIELFGPDYEWKGVVYDRETAHSRLKVQLEDSGLTTVPQPSWSKTHNALGVASKSTWIPAKSDWFVVDENGVKNYICISSSDTGLAVFVWVHARLMWHQLRDQDKVIERQSQLAMRIRDDWQRVIWPEYIAQHND